MSWYKRRHSNGEESFVNHLIANKLLIENNLGIIYNIK